MTQKVLLGAIFCAIVGCSFGIACHLQRIQYQLDEITAVMKAVNGVTVERARY